MIITCQNNVAVGCRIGTDGGGGDDACAMNIMIGYLIKAKNK